MTNLQKKELSGESSTQIVAQDNQNFNLEKLISQGIEKGMTVETMERLLAMRKELKAEWAKEQFTKAMSAFQNECPTIQKTKSVPTKSGGIAYKYAPIESIVGQVKGLLEKHGFSYSTTMEVLPNGVKACVKVVHIAGHSEESCMQVPLGTQTQIMSASQQTAAAQTFAKRYAFCNAFGILTGDEDNDGAIVPEVKHLDTEVEHTHNGEIVEQPKKTPSEKQKWLIGKLCKDKGITQEQALEMAKGKTPSEFIKVLMEYQPS